MRPEGVLKGRPLARHCDALFQQRRTPIVEPAEAPAFPAERLSQELSARLTRLTGGTPPRVRCGGPLAISARALGERIGGFAANALFGGAPIPLSVSIEAGAVLRLLDRTFGGRGEAPSPLPGAFPLSAELLIERIETILAEALTAVFGAGDAAPVALLRRHASFAGLAPFAADEALALHEFTIAAEDTAGMDWTLLVAYPPARYAALDKADAAEVPVRRGARGHVDGGDAGAAPYAEIPLTLGAVLVDMRIPLTRIAGLKVGDVLPVSVARNVPLFAGGKRIGAGAIGSFDDRVALQLTETF